MDNQPARTSQARLMVILGRGAIMLSLLALLGAWTTQLTGTALFGLRHADAKKPPRGIPAGAFCCAAKLQHFFHRDEELVRPWQAWQRPTLPSLET